MRSKRTTRSVPLRTLFTAALASTASCVAAEPSAQEGRATQTLNWYDQYRLRDGEPPPDYEAYIIPRHTTCAEMDMGNASVTMNEPVGPYCPDGPTVTATGPGGQTITARFTTDGQCDTFQWSATQPLDGIVVRGELEDRPLKSNAWRYPTPKTSSTGYAPALPVDGSYRIGAIEFCYTMSDGSGPGEDAGAESPPEGGGSSDAGDDDGGEIRGGKTW